MTPDELRDICLALPQAIETIPFGPEITVFKTSGNNKIFALSALDAEPLAVSVKVDPEDSKALQSEFPAIAPGYHLNKKHWITVTLARQPGVPGVPDDLVQQLIEDSHALVRPKVPRGRTT